MRMSDAAAGWTAALGTLAVIWAGFVLAGVEPRNAALMAPAVIAIGITALAIWIRLFEFLSGED